MFDLPEPLGPTMTATPGSSTILLRSAKDLKPLSVSDFRYKADLPHDVADSAGGSRDASRERGQCYHRGPCRQASSEPLSAASARCAASFSADCFEWPSAVAISSPATETA